MAFMKFYVGNEANASSHRDGIYIAVDTKKIFYNGSAYGGKDIDLSNYYTIAQVDEKIGTNVYTGANYISKETNLTEAVLQLDEEIKATNDNLALEHTNAEATYAKKTELGNYLTLTQANTKFTTFKRMLASNSDTWGKMNVGGYVVAYTTDLSDVSENGPFSIIGGNQATVIQVNPGANAFSSQLAIGFDRPQLAFRRTDSTGDESKWGPWQKVLTWGNIEDKPDVALKSEILTGSVVQQNEDIIVNIGSNSLAIKTRGDIYGVEFYANGRLVSGIDLSRFLTSEDASNIYQPKGNYLTSVSWFQVSGKPTFATVAISGDYDDLTNKPTIPNVSAVDNAGVIAVAIGSNVISFRSDGISFNGSNKIAFPVVEALTTEEINNILNS